jgi:hypothetical protein
MPSKRKGKWSRNPTIYLFFAKNVHKTINPFCRRSA